MSSNKYFPKGRIQENLYTNGGEFTKTSTGEDYIGKYYKTYDGKCKTGPNPLEGPSESLEATNNQQDSRIPQNNFNKAYLQNSSIKVNTNILNLAVLIDPTPIQAIPTEEDYKRGYYLRFFAQKRKGQAYSIVEIDEETYTDLTTNQQKYNYLTWKALKLFWQLTGPKKDNKTNRTQVVAGIEDTNLRLIRQQEKGFPGLNLYLKDPLQYARVTIPA
jgi:hypothetical protein